MKRCSFTIQLKCETTNYTQKLTLGMNTGSGVFATAVVNEKNEILYISEVEVRNDIHKKWNKERNTIEVEKTVKQDTEK